MQRAESLHAVVHADGSYIVTGGLGGLGIVVTRWLVTQWCGAAYPQRSNRTLR